MTIINNYIYSLYCLDFHNVGICTRPEDDQTPVIEKLSIKLPQS